LANPLAVPVLTNQQGQIAVRPNRTEHCEELMPKEKQGRGVQSIAGWITWFCLTGNAVLL
jgi:hypothetical protein